tara:strand:+ start:98 stop:340 length:243 start_codon:yes stop_codon:yes gene_type:complete
MEDQDPMQMTSKQVRQSCLLDEACQKLMHQAVRDFGLTSADHDNILRYAKKEANMAGYESINKECLLEAIKHHQAGYRPK